MPLAIPDCWAGLRHEDWRWHREHAPAHYKVELLDGVLVLTLRTRRDRELIADLAEALRGSAADHDPDLVVYTSLHEPAAEPAPDDDRRLRRHSLFHEAAASEIRAALDRALGAAGLAERHCALLGAGWQPVPDGPLYWVDVCLLPWHALVGTVGASAEWTSRPPPQLAVEVTEHATAAFDRSVRSRAYADGGCPWLLLVDPPDPERHRVETVFEVWDLTDPAATSPARRATDRIHLAEPVPVTVDLAALGDFTRAVVKARNAGEL
jgi:hypothetical protein